MRERPGRCGGFGRRQSPYTGPPRLPCLSPTPTPSALPALPLLLFAPPGFIRSVWEELGLLGGGPLWRQPGRGLHNLCFHSRPVEQGAWLPPFWRSRVCRGSEKSQFQPSTCQELAGSSGTLRGGV